MERSSMGTGFWRDLGYAKAGIGQAHVLIKRGFDILKGIAASASADRAAPNSRGMRKDG